jgi:GNAT superfamily N-acetyltransferase
MIADPIFRPARADDLPALIEIFAADRLGGHPDGTDPALLPFYREALDDILANPRERLVVGEIAGRPVATGQLSLLRSLPHRGRRHALIEAVQVAPDLRGRGIGAALIGHLIAIARAEGAGVVELTSNGRRLDAHRFYERLGFAKSHFGFKLALD